MIEGRGLVAMAVSLMGALLPIGMRDVEGLGVAVVAVVADCKGSDREERARRDCHCR